MQHEHTENYYNGGPCVGCGAPAITFSELYYFDSFEKNSLHEQELRLIHAAAGGIQEKMITTTSRPSFIDRNRWRLILWAITVNLAAFAASNVVPALYIIYLVINALAVIPAFAGIAGIVVNIRRRRRERSAARARDN